MSYASNEELSHLRSILKLNLFSRPVLIEDVSISDCIDFYEMVITHWSSVPSPEVIHSYACELESMPKGLYKKLVDIYTCHAH